MDVNMGGRGISVKGVEGEMDGWMDGVYGYGEVWVVEVDGEEGRGGYG